MGQWHHLAQDTSPELSVVRKQQTQYEQSKRRAKMRIITFFNNLDQYVQERGEQKVH